MRIWGKIIGGVLGLSVGGPMGALLGVVIGHLHDKGSESKGSSRIEGPSQHQIFTEGVVFLGAKMAKVDGRVTRAEILAFKRVFKVEPSQEAYVGSLFDRARQSADGYEPYAYRLAQSFPRSVLGEILSGLFIIASSDGARLSAGEFLFLKRVSQYFNFDAADFAHIAARSGVTLPSQDKPRNEALESYAILGVEEKATSEEVKIAYRALIREHHPDKLMAQGLPPSLMATATEKMKRINVAYGVVCKVRGIK